MLAAIEAARGDGGAPNMVSAMAAAVDAKHGKLTDKEIEEEFITLRGAGHETTSNTISWVLLLLAQHPAFQQRIRDEVVANVRGESATYDELEALQLCRMTVLEALRLFPTIPAYPRLSVKPTKLGKYDLPKGSFVVVSQPALNVSKSLWGDDATDFRPERFDRPGFSLNLVQSKAFGCPGYAVKQRSATAAGAPPPPPPPPAICPTRSKSTHAADIAGGAGGGGGGHPFGFAPFGAGRRTCIGQRLAMMEAVQITASIIKHFRVELAAPAVPVEEIADLTLGPKEGLSIKLSEW